MASYVADEAILCPHCNAMQDDAAEDFVVPGFEKDKCPHDCYACDGQFTVHLEGGLYIVEKK